MSSQTSNSLYMLSPSHHLCSYSVTHWQSSVVSLPPPPHPPTPSLTKRLWVRRCQGVDASFCLTRFVLSRTRTRPLSACCLSAAWWMQGQVCARAWCVWALLHYSFTVQKAEVPVSVRQLLQMFRDGDLMEKTPLDRKTEQRSSSSTIISKFM